MQLSVKAHATIYGDVKESEINPPSYIKEKLGLLDNKTSASEKAVVEAKFEMMKAPEARADLMKASG
jgi:hypothetical protein